VDVKYEGPGYGKPADAVLSVDGKDVAQTKIGRTIPVRFSLDETLDVCRDTGTPVVEDYADKMPFEFTGTLNKVVIKLGESGLRAGDQKALQDGDRNVAAMRE
jgi:arylsulfatase